MRRLTVQKVRDQLRTMLQRLVENSFSSRISLHHRHTIASRPIGALISMHTGREAWRRTCTAG